MKAYIKRGNKNYKERRILDELMPVLEEKFAKDPDFSIVPARNFNELKQLYTRHVVEPAQEVDFTEIPEKEDIKETPEIKETEMAKEEIEDATEVQTETSGGDGGQFVDPLNRKEPIVRDYVFGDQSIDKDSNKKTKTFDSGPSSFAEPQNFDEAFVIPDDDEEDDSKSKKKTENTSGSKPSEKKNEPVNPHWDEMKGSVQKKKTKKFAKYIVEAVATLQQKGFVYYANKDINEAKLTEYELEGLMDLSLLVALEDGQEVTVKQFFQVQCQKAEELSHLSREQKEDLTDSLTEVLMEKGAGPTPTQELMLVTLTIIGGQALTLMTLKSQTNSLLSQLKAMNQDDGGGAGYEEPWHQQQTEMETQPESVEQEEPIQEETPTPEPVEQDIKTLEIGETIETKE